MAKRRSKKISPKAWIVLGVIIIGLIYFAGFAPQAFSFTGKNDIVATSVEVTGSFTGTKFKSGWEAQTVPWIECTDSPYVSSSWTCKNAKQTIIGTITADKDIKGAKLKLYSYHHHASSSAWRDGHKGVSNAEIYIKNQETGTWERILNEYGATNIEIIRNRGVGDSAVFFTHTFTKENECLGPKSYKEWTKQECTYFPYIVTKKYIRDGKVMDMKTVLSVTDSRKVQVGVDATDFDYVQVAEPPSNVTPPSNETVIEPICGNDKCEVGENVISCLEDCAAVPDCGDQICDLNFESCGTCPLDCGDCIAPSPITDIPIIDTSNVVEFFDLEKGEDTTKYFVIAMAGLGVIGYLVYLARKRK